MTHDDVIRALAYAYPTSEWSYDGDGSTLDPVTGEDGVLVARGLEWHDSKTAAPTLEELATQLANVPPPAPPIEDQLASALAQLPASETITGADLTNVIALLRAAAGAS